MVIPNSRYNAWIKDAVAQVQNYLLDRYGVLPFFQSEVSVRATIYRHTKRRADLVNVLQSICDALQEADVIMDDFQIKSLDGSRLILGVPKEEARAEIEVEILSAD